MNRKEIAEESAYFVIGAFPYWYTLWLPEKTPAYWWILLWACFVWLVYGIRKKAPMVVINTSVEIMLVLRGIMRL